MSVVLGLLSPNFITLACDGRLSTRQPDGSLKAKGEFCKKIALLGGGKAAIGITGSSTLSKVLTEELEAAAREMCFDELVEHTRALAQKRLAEYSRALVIEGIAILLAGWDGNRPRVFHLGSLDNFTPEEILNSSDQIGACSIGGDAALPVRDRAFEWLCAGARPAAEAAGQFTEMVIQEMAARFSHTINGNTWSITMSPQTNYETHCPIPDEPEVLVDAEVDGVIHGRVLQTALTSNQPDLSKSGILGKHLGNIGDDTPSGRFARTSVHSSHAPTTNPLTATDAGTNVTVNIAANTMQVGATAVSNNSGSVTALSYSTLYYIYYDDPSLAGGAVSYQATTTKTTAINGAGRFFIGSILTPKATAPDTNGNGDGGTGSQVGTLIKFFGNSAVPTTAGVGSVSSPSSAIDGDPTTSASLICSATNTSNSAQLVLSGFPGILTGRAQTITLKVLSQNGVAGATGTISSTVSYSLNGGSTFTTIWNSTLTRPLTIDSVTLPFTLNPGVIQVKAVRTCTATGNETGTLSIFEAWVEIQE